MGSHTRKHHARCETKDDPPSPQVLGIRTVLWEGAELYRKAAQNQDTLDRYGHGTPDDWLERRFYSGSPRAGITSMFFINLILFGVPGVTIWAIQMMWIPLFAAGIINGIGHYKGYRNFEPSDASTNILPWGIIIGGEELHNNHHTFPTSAKLSIKWWEFDIGWFYIRLFSALGLATVKKVSPRLQVIRGKSTIDDNTLKAVLLNRFQVLAKYSQDVIVPVLKEEKRQADSDRRPLFDQIRHALIREESLIDESGRQRLRNFLESTKALNQVYSYRQKLQAIWSKTTATQRELVEALTEWCHQAETSGILALQRFAIELRQYHC
jgi:stearoyl-CoA desaturase (Delta-9 desaturase)